MKYELLVLSPKDVRALLSLEECIEAVEQAFRQHGEGKVAAPGVLGVHSAGGGFHIKAGLLRLHRNYFVAKVNGNFPGNPSAFGLPTIQGLIVLSDADNGRPLAVMDSIEITAMRTAAATAVAAKYLAAPDSRVVTICGCGRQGLVQLRALARVRDLERVFAYDVQADQATRFAQEFMAESPVSVEPVSDLAAAVRQSQICVTCTPSREPILGVRDVIPGTFVAAVGADNPEKQELHPELMKVSKIVVDLLEQCAVMGDLHHAIEAGVVTRSDVHAELGEVVAGQKPGRTSNQEIVVFDSTGVALQDVAAAAVTFENAQKRGCGVWLDFTA